MAAAPPSFADVQTAERYALGPVSMAMLNPITNQPVAVLENTVYMVEGLTDPQQLVMALTDSVTRWWFQTHGTRKDPVAESNGHHDQTIYSAKCEGCTQAWVFGTPATRAAFMREHIDSTGHTMRWSDDTRTIEGVTDGGQDQGNIPQGHQGI